MRYRSKVTDDQNPFTIFTHPLMRQNTRFPRIRQTPFKPFRLTITFIQRLFRTIQVIQISGQFLYTLVTLILQQEPLQLVVVIPLRCLAKFRAHKVELFSPADRTYNPSKHAG